MTCCKLKYTNPYKEEFYFVALGDPWPRNPELRLVRKSTKFIKLAKCFDTAKDAAEILVLIGNPIGWEILVEDPDATS